jgi:hypothetical protein
MDDIDRGTHRADLSAHVSRRRALSRSHHQRKLCRANADVLELACADSTVPVEAALVLPEVMLLAVEDACVRVHELAWQARRPSWWNPRAALRWHAEAAELRRRQERVRTLGDRYLGGPLTFA